MRQLGEFHTSAADGEGSSSSGGRPPGRGSKASTPLGARNLALAEKVHELATEKGCTSSQLALAWVLAQGADVVPIPGTSSVARLEENVAAVDVRLSGADLARLEEIAPRGSASESATRRR